MTSIGPAFDPGAGPRRRVGLRLALAVLVVAIAGVTWWHLHGGGTAIAPRNGFEEVAAAAPEQTQVLLAFDGRGQVNMATLVTALEALKKETGEFGKQVGDFEAESGIHLGDLPKWLAPAGMVALMPLEGQKTMAPSGSSRGADFVACLTVTDEDAARQMIDAVVRARHLSPAETDVEGLKLRVVGEGDRQIAYGVGYKRLWIGSGPLAVGRGMKALSGRAPSLADAPRFVDARKRCPSSNGLLAWVDVQNGAAALASLPGVGPYADGQTLQALAALDYLVVATDPLGKGQDAQLFLKIDAKSENEFARALLDAKPVAPTAARFVPAKWGTCLSVNTTWLGAVAYQAAVLLPMTRTRFSNLPPLASLFLGFDPVASFRAATTGDLVVTSDVLASLPEGKPTSVLCVLPLKDQKAASQLIERLEKKARMSSHVVKTSDGLEIRRLDALDLHYAMAAAPQPALLFARGPAAVTRIEEAVRSQAQPAASMEAVPDVQALTKQARGAIVETDYHDFSSLVTWASQRLAAKSTSSPGQGMAKTWLLEHLKGGGPYTLTSVVSVEADGLRVQTRGLSASLLTGGIGVAAASAVSKADDGLGRR